MCDPEGSLGLTPHSKLTDTGLPRPGLGRGVLHPPFLRGPWEWRDPQRGGVAPEGVVSCQAWWGDLDVPPGGWGGVVLLALQWKVEQCLCFLLSFPPPPF